MSERVGAWNTSEKAVLHCWKLVFNVPSSTWHCGAANIIKTNNPADIVYGVIYDISDSQLDILTTKYEKVSPIDVKVESGGKSICAKAYSFKVDRPKLKPNSEYLKKILQGLTDHGYEKSILELVISEANSVK
jgi:hypothetical protein